MTRVCIIARKHYCARVLELINSFGNLRTVFTNPKLFNGNEVSVFFIEGKFSDIIEMEKWIKGEFASDDVLSSRFVEDTLTPELT